MLRTRFKTEPLLINAPRAEGPGIREVFGWRLCDTRALLPRVTRIRLAARCGEFAGAQIAISVSWGEGCGDINGDLDRRRETDHSRSQAVVEGGLDPAM